MYKCWIHYGFITMCYQEKRNKHSVRLNCLFSQLFFVCFTSSGFWNGKKERSFPGWTPQEGVTSYKLNSVSGIPIKSQWFWTSYGENDDISCVSTVMPEWHFVFSVRHINNHTFDHTVKLVWLWLRSQLQNNVQSMTVTVHYFSGVLTLSFSLRALWMMLPLQIRDSV